MTWKTINQILRKNKRTQTSLPSELNVNEKAIQNPSTICDELNQHFCNIGHKLAKAFNASPLEFISQSFRGQRIKNSFYLEPISENEVLEIITGLNPNKAPGVDEIPTKLIKAAKYVLAPYLTINSNQCLEKGEYPDELKIARVTPLHKGGSKSKAKNYRPISVLSSFNNILETLLKRRLTKFWNKFNVLTTTQFGFRENYSTTLAIAHLHERILSNLDNNRKTCAIFMDLAKAFDTVNHDILLHKLENYGIRGVSKNLIKSYLTNCKQYVCCEGFTSPLSDVKIGIPQGSVLGPILFLIYINDLANCSNFDTTLYADDCVLTISHKNTKSLQINLDNELVKISAWLKHNQLSLNTNKTKFLYFTNTNENIFVQIDGCRINQSNHVKYLGVYLDDKLNWHKHVEYIETKLSAATGALFKLSKYVPTRTLVPVYYSLAYSHLQYAIITRGNSAKSNIHKLQVKQNRMVKIMCKKHGRKLKLLPSYHKLQILKIEGIYKLQTAKFMANVHANNFPETDNNFLKFRKMSSVHSYPTRHALSDNYHPQRFSFAKSKQSVKTMGVKIWNILPKLIKEKVSANINLKSLSKLLKQHFLNSQHL